MLPDEKQEESKAGSGNQSEERQRNRRHSRCIRRDGIDVKDQPTDTDKQKNGPSDGLQIRPFHSTVPVRREWFNDGPFAPDEFTRKSSAGRQHPRI